MNAEKLHDALNYLDDSMILETDRLRHKKKKTVIFRRFISVAACICIVATTVFGIGHMRSIKENSPLDENFETSQNKGDIPHAPENSQSTENQPPAADESAPAEDQEKDENFESKEEFSPEEESATEEESAPAEEMPPLEEDPPAEEAPPENTENRLVLKITDITENGFKGCVKDETGIFEKDQTITVIYKGEEQPKEGATVCVYFIEYEKNTVTAESILIVKE